MDDKRVGNIVTTVTFTIGLAFIIVSVVFVRAAVDTAATDVARFSDLFSTSLVYELGLVDTDDHTRLKEAISAFGFDENIQVTAFDAEGAVLASTSHDIQEGTDVAGALPDEAQGLLERLEPDVEARPQVWVGLDGLMPRDQALYLFRYSPDADCYVLICNHGHKTFEGMRQQVTNLALVLALVMLTLLFLLMYIVRTYRKRLIQAATTDELTGLANRKAFTTAYEELSDQGHLGDYSIALVDVDLFKSVNDTYGHAAGDEALAAVASCVREAAGVRGLGGRWGGDEFIVVCRGSVADCTQAFEDMTSAVRALKPESGAKLSISVGAARVLDGQTLEQAVERADDALYVTKEHGRGFVTTYEEGVTPHMVKDGSVAHAVAVPAASGASPSDAAEPAAGPTFAAAQRRFWDLVLDSLLVAVDKMVPFVAAGGIFIALAFLVDGAIVDLESLSMLERSEFGSITPLAAGLKEVGSAAFNFMLPIFAAFFAASLGGEEAFMAGFAGGYLASTGNSGFLGAILAGVVSAGVCNLMRGYVAETRQQVQRIAKILLYPLFSLAIMYLIMHFFLEPLALAIEGSLASVLEGMKGGNRTLLGAVLGAMMATDMGGFINKCAYHFGTASIAAGDTDLMAAVMVGGMVPPLGIAFSMLMFPTRFTKSELERGPTTAIMGLAFITEGAIPFAITDFARVIFASMVGSATAGALSCFCGCTLMAPHGGIFVFPVVGNASFYMLSLFVGSFVTALVLGFVKPVRKQEPLSLA